MQLKDSVFFVTGGASGLGEATARMLVQSGARVAIADVNEAAGARLVSELGSSARFARVDVTDESSVRRGLELASELGTLRGVVNAAGIVLAEKVLGKNGPHALDAFMRVIQVNLGGTLQRHSPRIGDDERDRAHRRAASAASSSTPRRWLRSTDRSARPPIRRRRAASSAMTLPIARELARYGIRVMTIAPGIFDTPLMASLPQAARESLATQVPFPPRLGNPPEYAALVKHIIENEMLNGEVIRLDGAIRMAPK